ncbi:MAG: RIP metalloprotease RseP [Firmicutes bacterium]|nr:RIP metalloprotease RseP [Bacillota bacterium]
MMFILALAMFGVLIFFHELGHFTLAKLFGVKVREFAVGMGQKIYAVQRGETLYSLRLLPIGGFVNLAGERPDDRDDERGFHRKSVGRRILIIVAGPAMNFFLATLLFSAFYFVAGVFIDRPEIGRVFQGEPADQAGLRSGDRITAVDGREVETWRELVEIINNKPNVPLRLEIERESGRQNLAVTPRYDPEGRRGLIGVGPAVERFSFPSSVVRGAQSTALITYLMIRSIVLAIGRQVGLDLVGPVGIVQAAVEAANTGFSNFLWFAGIVSLTVGLVNLLPIPALDGSRIAFLTVEAVRGKPVDPEAEGFVHFIGFVLLLLLLLVVTYRDILKLVVE